MADAESSIAEKVRASVECAPDAPGCYLFKNVSGKVLYVGKAKILKHRVRTYMRPDADGRLHIPRMVEQAASLEFVITSNEKEALVLENNLIKLHKPRFNLSLRDDKTYTSVRIDFTHDFPRPQIIHKYKKDGALYVGPFASSFKLRLTLEALKREFPLRRCSDHVMRNRTRVCVYHDIGVCCGPCVPGNVTKEQYREYLDGLVALLRGKDDTVIRKLEATMRDAARREDYEAAAHLRDLLFAIRETVESQSAQIAGRKSVSRDVIGLFREGERTQVQVLLYRDDKLVGSGTHDLDSPLPDDELIEQFTARYYERDHPIPPEVLLPVEVDVVEGLSAYLSDKAGFTVAVSTPKRGDKLALVKLAALNAEHAMRERETAQATVEATLARLQEALHLENAPRRMECYDISHFQGDEVVGSGVCFADGKPDKSRYRRYKIKTVEGNDDFASLEEVLRRRLSRGMDEGDFPDLIVIDGGAQQLSRVRKVFDELNIVGVDLVGLAKSRDKTAKSNPANYSSRAPRVVTDERVFLPGRDDPVTLNQRAPELFLLMRLRDEAHRFAIAYHRERKRKQALVSGLDAVPGLGPKRKRALIRHFGSPARVKEASVEQLLRVEGVTAKLAQAIVSHFAAQTPKAS